MAKKKKVTLVNSGLCSIYFKGDRHLPGDEFEIAESELENKGVEHLISRGDLIIKDDSDATNAVIERAKKGEKKDPRAGKSRKELEDGGEF